MKELSKRTLRTIASDYRRSFGIRPRFLSVSGTVDSQPGPGIDALSVVRKARLHALSEAVRWGEPYSFLLAPGVISWIVPVVDRYDLLGGMLGGEVLADSDSEDWSDAVDHLVRHGATRTETLAYLKKLPVWPQARCQQAVERLHHLVYQVTGFTPALLNEHHEHNLQQRQIAEEIHRSKQARESNSPADGEQALLSLIRAGDRKGARKILNQVLGKMFLRSANLTVIRALMIEMMGYLVRRAVEDSPFLEPIMEKNHRWMARIIEASDFEDLTAVVRHALDDFMDNIYAMGYAATNPHVNAAMAYLGEHFREPVSLEDVAQATGLSTYRIAHLIKEQTGRSIIRHVHLLRVEEARKLLRDTAMECVDIALEVGFCDQSYLSRQFKKYTGVSPSRYRHINAVSSPGKP